MARTIKLSIGEQVAQLLALPLHVERVVKGVRQAIEKPRSIRQVARDLGVNDRTVRRWLRGTSAPAGANASNLYSEASRARKANFERARRAGAKLTERGTTVVPVITRSTRRDPDDPERRVLGNTLVIHVADFGESPRVSLDHVHELVSQYLGVRGGRPPQPATVFLVGYTPDPSPEEAPDPHDPTTWGRVRREADVTDSAGRRWFKRIRGPLSLDPRSDGELWEWLSSFWVMVEGGEDDEGEEQEGGGFVSRVYITDPRIKAVGREVTTSGKVARGSRQTAKPDRAQDRKPRGAPTRAKRRGQSTARASRRKR